MKALSHNCLRNCVLVKFLLMFWTGLKMYIIFRNKIQNCLCCSFFVAHETPGTRNMQHNNTVIA